MRDPNTTPDEGQEPACGSAHLNIGIAKMEPRDRRTEKSASEETYKPDSVPHEPESMPG